MIETLTLWLMTKGLKEKAAKRLLIGAAVVATFVACVFMKSCYDNSIRKEHEAGVQAEQVDKKIVADERASEQRAEDTIKNNELQKGREDVISQSEDSTPSDSAVALGCQRLRNQGYRTDTFPECNGR